MSAGREDRERATEREDSSARGLSAGQVTQNKRQMGIPHAAFSVTACVISISAISLLGYQFARIGLFTQMLVIAFTVLLNFFSFYIIVGPTHSA